MNEAFLWYLWKYRLYSHALCTITGEPITVEHPGFQNSDSGPDFFNARIRIGNTLWAGNVEVHVRASDWLRHKHQNDPAFNTVILHVVYDSDIPITRSSGEVIPVVELRNFIDDNRWSQYKKFVSAAGDIACSKLIGSLRPIYINQWLDRTLTSRLERKSLILEELLIKRKYDWEDAFYFRMASSFGFKVNSLPFELLADALPLIVLMKHKNELQVEAMLFGQAGLLQGHFRDEYPARLKKEYIYLRKKLSLAPFVDAHLWKMSRMRPVNFPFTRIAQFAKLLSGSKSILSAFIEESRLEKIFEILQVNPDPYWNDHYRFDHPAPYCTKQLGNEAANNLIINTVIPFIFYYGKKRGIPALCGKALQWLEECKPENNRITRQWHAIGIKAENAFHSQALIELKNELCSKKKCLICGIGIKLLNET